MNINRMRCLVGAGMIGVLAVAGCSSGSKGGGGASTTTASGGGSSSATASGGGFDTVAIDVGTGTPVKIPTKHLRIAFVAAGFNDPLSVVQKQGIEEVAKKYGATVTTFDAQLNPDRQFNLYQNVVSSGQYDVLITLPMVGQQVCTILTKTAPEKNILVVDMTLPLCGRDTNPGTDDSQWAPGTLGLVGYFGNPGFYPGLAKSCADATGGGGLILLNAPKGIPSSGTMLAGFKSESRFKVLENYETNFSPEDGAAKTAAALKTHPDLKVIGTTNAGLAFGAIGALQSAGRTPGKDVFVCNGLGGSAQMLDLVKQGKLTVDTYGNGRWVATAAMQSAFNAINGKPDPRVTVPGTDGTIVKSSQEVWPKTYTKDQAASLTPTGM